MKNLVVIITLVWATCRCILNLKSIIYVLQSLKHSRGLRIAGSIWFIPFLSTKKLGHLR